MSGENTPGRVKTPPGGKWAGARVRAARTHWSALLPLPCYRCGRPVQPWQRWHVEHMRERAIGGSHDVANQWVSHGRCNESAGAALGRRLNAARNRTQPMSTNGERRAPEAARGIRGI